jgi:type IV pilus biogenesis protein CpaD/CtpE
MNARTVFLLAAAVALAACGSLSKPTATEADFGNSVASMQKAQVANPETLNSPSTETPTGVDPDYADAVLETLRESVSQPEEVGNPIVIQIGAPGGN